MIKFANNHLKYSWGWYVVAIFLMFGIMAITLKGTAEAASGTCEVGLENFPIANANGNAYATFYVRMQSPSTPGSEYNCSGTVNSDVLNAGAGFGYGRANDIHWGPQTWDGYTAPGFPRQCVGIAPDQPGVGQCTDLAGTGFDRGDNYYEVFQDDAGRVSINGNWIYCNGFEPWCGPDIFRNGSEPSPGAIRGAGFQNIDPENMTGIVGQQPDGSLNDIPFELWSRNTWSGNQVIVSYFSVRYPPLPPPPPPPPPTCSAGALPSVISIGQATTLSWSTTNSTTVIIDYGIGAVPASGSVSQTPTESRIYTVTVWGPGGVVQCGAPVTVQFPSLSCQNVNPNVIERGQPANITVSFRNSGSGTLLNASLSVGIIGLYPTTTVAYSNGAGPPANPNNLNANTTGTSTPINIANPATAGEYTVQLTVTGGNTPGGTFTCNISTPLIVATRPYMRLYGGDSVSGIGIAQSNTNACTLPGEGRFIGFNRGAAGYAAGGGSQLGLFSRSRNVDFVSAALRISTPSPLKGLTFANTGPADPSANANYGGDWGAGYLDSLCVPDPLAGQTIDPDGDVPGRTLGAGVKDTIYMDGDAFISGDITYPNEASFGKPANIPAFRLIVRGNIYIQPNVERISGQLVAQPRNDGTGGRIYTCGHPGWVSDSVPAIQYLPTANQLVTQCNKKLTIFGSVTAQTLKLMRTNGTVGSSSVGEPYGSGNIAESIIFPPELWIAEPETATSSSVEPYHSFLSLPPIL